MQGWRKHKLESICRVEEYLFSLTVFLSPDAMSNPLSQCVFKVA